MLPTNNQQLERTWKVHDSYLHCTAQVPKVTVHSVYYTDGSSSTVSETASSVSVSAAGASSVFSTDASCGVSSASESVLDAILSVLVFVVISKETIVFR